MYSGAILGIVLFSFLTLWGIADFIIWLTGRQTFSQWVIKKSKERASFAVASLLIITLFALWLIVHFELFDIIQAH